MPESVFDNLARVSQLPEHEAAATIAPHPMVTHERGRGHDPGPHDHRPDATDQLRRLSEFERRTVRWLWQGYIPLGRITFLEGDPDQAVHHHRRPGRSGDHRNPCPTHRRLTAATSSSCPPRMIRTTRSCCASRRSRGRGPGACARPGRRVRLFPETPTTWKRSSGRGAKLVILDPVAAFFGDGVRTHTYHSPVGDGSARRLAARTGCAIIVIRHLTRLRIEPRAARQGSIG